mmetsp:Transcript_28537/g.66848  ORF Transcript_28537/g.66848 Transcript_28537/m.66848 type:complete len:586 (-) Transcript_28537:326-2083(-)
MRKISVLVLVPFMLIAWLQWASVRRGASLGRVPNVGAVDGVHSDAITRALVRAQQQAAIATRQIEQHATAASAPPVNMTTATTTDQHLLGTPTRAQAPVGQEATVSLSHTAIEAPANGGGCGERHKPYHTVLTATGQVYQQWQCRVMYWHWKKQKAADPKGSCTELTGFTRLVANAKGESDGLEEEIPSFFVKEYSGSELVRFGGYRVINRPYSVVQFLKTSYWRAIKEEYIYVAETDHILMHAIPNTASRGSPMAYVFGYMGVNPAHARVIEGVWPDGGRDGYRKVQPIGPSPVLIHRDDLERIARPWNDISIKLKTNPAADRMLGWVIEMWGYAVAAASLSLKHQELRDFQVEPGALSSAAQLRGFATRYWIFHYTYQFEYMLDGTACAPWTIGEFSLDKRHFSSEYPVAPLPQPPHGANEAAFYLLRAFNEAMLSIAAWPSRQPPSELPVQTLYGRRRLDWFSRHANGFATERRSNALVKALAGSVWECGKDGGSKQKLELAENGGARGIERATGRWGSLNDPTLGAPCPVHHCLFVDFSGGNKKYDVGVDEDNKKLHLMLQRRGTSSPSSTVSWRCWKSMD